MKIRQFILAAGLAFAVLTTSAWSITLPPTDDTYSVLTLKGKPPTVTKASIASSFGASSTLPVSKTNNVFIQFNVGGSGIAPASVAKATLTLYFPLVTKAGDLDLSVVTQDWTEKFTGPAKAEPAFAPSFQTIPAVEVVAKQFVIVDVTSQVKAWLTTPSADFGFAVSAASDGLAKALIAAKEGPGSGYPAVIQIETNPEVAANGNFIIPTGSVGIGTANPSKELDVALTANPVASGDSFDSSISLRLTNTNASGTVASPSAVGIGFGATTTQQAIVGGTFGNDFLEFFTGGDLIHPKMAIDFAGHVGIGTAAPGATLDISPASGANVVGFHQSPLGSFQIDAPGVAGGRLNVTTDGTVGVGSGGIFNIDAPNVSGGRFSVKTNGTVEIGSGGIFDVDAPNVAGGRLTVLANGNVGIGTTSPAVTLDVNGGIRCIGAVNTSSDARYKTNVQPLSGALEQVLHLKGVSYDWNKAGFPGKHFDDRPQIGFIAQEVREILPDVVSEDSEGYLSIGYSAIIPVLTEAIKEQQSRIDALKAENAALAAKVDGLATRDREREARLARVERAMEDSKARVVSASIEFK